MRFRLGGATFPPLIYYKIFTKNPVVDINAFAPRNYAQEDESELRAREAAHQRCGGAVSTACSEAFQQLHAVHGTTEELRVPGASQS